MLTGKTHRVLALFQQIKASRNLAVTDRHASRVLEEFGV